MSEAGSGQMRRGGGSQIGGPSDVAPSAEEARVLERPVRGPGRAQPPGQCSPRGKLSRATRRPGQARRQRKAHAVAGDALTWPDQGRRGLGGRGLQRPRRARGCRPRQCWSGQGDWGGERSECRWQPSHLRLGLGLSRRRLHRWARDWEAGSPRGSEHVRRSQRRRAPRERGHHQGGRDCRWRRCGGREPGQRGRWRRGRGRRGGAVAGAAGRTKGCRARWGWARRRRWRQGQGACRQLRRARQ